MIGRQAALLTTMMVLATNVVATRTSAQDLVIDHLDGTATIVTLEEAHLGMVIDKSSWHEPMIGHYTYLNIGVDMADMRLVDSVELLQGVADPGYVQEVFRIAAGTGAYDGIVASFKYDSYGAFVLESDFMGVYQSTFGMEQPGCNAGLLEDAARQVWTQVQDDAAARDIDLTAYDGLVWWFPFNNDCRTAGFAYLAPVSHLFDHPYRVAVIAFPALYFVKHELGHTLGLGHLNCFFEDGEVDEFCEGGNMGWGGGWFVTEAGDPHPDRRRGSTLTKTAAHNQYLLGWTSPTGETRAADQGEDVSSPRGVAGAAAPDSTYLEVTTSGTYRISAHRGPASENAYPELLVIPGQVQYKYWFISFEEGDCFNPDLGLYFKIAEQVEKVTVRYQYLHPGEFSDSIREALLGVGECVTLDDSIEVCNEVLYGSEAADVRVTFPRLRTRRPAVRRLLPPP